MKPFHSALGAVGFLEREVAGPVGVLIVVGNPRTMKLTTYRVEYDRVVPANRYPGDQGWAPVRKEVARG